MQQLSTMRAHGVARPAMDQVIDEHFRFEGRDDVAGVLGTLSDDVDHDVVGSPMGSLRGRQSARTFYERLFADLKQQQVTSTHRYYGDDFVVDESVWRGIAVGTPLGFPGRNRPLEFRILHIFEFASDGAIRRENVWMDLAAIAAQLRDDAPPHGTSGAQQPAMSSTVPSPKDTVLRFYAAFDGNALDGFDAIDRAFRARVFGATVLDWPGFLAFGQSFLAGFPNGRHIFDFVVAEGDVVTTIGHYRGRHERPFMGVPATGRDVDFTVMHLDVVRDGRIVEHRGIGDINTMWAQLGVQPPTTT